MHTKRVENLHPSLVTKFKDPSQRQSLFVDYFRVKGVLEHLALLVTVRHEVAQEYKLKYKLFSREDLLDRHHQEEKYVDLIIEDCKKHKRYKVDKLDKSKLWYWGVDKESMTLSKAKLQSTCF